MRLQRERFGSAGLEVARRIIRRRRDGPQFNGSERDDCAQARKVDNSLPLACGCREPHTLPKLPRLTSRLPKRATQDDLVREANRIGRKLDLLIRGEWSPNRAGLEGWLRDPGDSVATFAIKNAPCEALR